MCVFMSEHCWTSIKADERIEVYNGPVWAPERPAIDTWGHASASIDGLRLAQSPRRWEKRRRTRHSPRAAIRSGLGHVTKQDEDSMGGGGGGT
jgi:hypothetical protein